MCCIVSLFLHSALTTSAHSSGTRKDVFIRIAQKPCHKSRAESSDEMIFAFYFAAEKNERKMESSLTV